MVPTIGQIKTVVGVLLQEESMQSADILLCLPVYNIEIEGHNGSTFKHRCQASDHDKIDAGGSKFKQQFFEGLSVRHERPGETFLRCELFPRSDTLGPKESRPSRFGGSANGRRHQPREARLGHLDRGCCPLSSMQDSPNFCYPNSNQSFWPDVLRKPPQHPSAQESVEGEQQRGGEQEQHHNRKTRA